MAVEKHLSALSAEVSSRSAESDSIYSKYLHRDIIKNDRLSDWQEDVGKLLLGTEYYCIISDNNFSLCFVFLSFAVYRGKMSY